MRIIRSENFDNMVNSALNKAISIADSWNCGEVNCSHMLMAVIGHPELAEKFHSDTGATAEEFKNALKFQCEQGYYGKKSELSSDANFELSIELVTKPLDRVFSVCLTKAKQERMKVNLMMMYNELFADKKSEVYQTLDALGIRPEDVMCSTENDPMSTMPITSKFGVDMTIMARKKLYDPIESREDIIDKLIEVLGRRQKGNPCLIGEPGVGKTAIVEGLAQQIVAGNVPNYMKGKHIISIDVSGIVSGSKFRGEFEERFNGMLYEAAAHPNVILFFDEFHMLMEAGASSTDGAMNAANILKPAISRGDIRIIGATTIKEYAKHVESDGAFNRRIQSILVDEPDVPTAVKMIKKIAPVYAEYHNCRLFDNVIEAAVRMSDRYITDKRLPDKAVTVIDETAARLKAYAPDNVVIDITEDDIRTTISKNTGIDVTDIDSASKNKLQTLEENLRKHVIGQDSAINCVVKSIRRAKAGIKDPNRPIGSFLFVGPTGVGKTELTKAVATEFSGNIKNLIKFDMSEFMEKHAVSRMVGAPPGYVGYGEGGQLTEAVRHNPNSVILFDEIEKAHPDVFNIMLQILEDGVLTDSKGIKVDFKNCIIVMTSNAGYGKNEGTVHNIGFGSTKHIENVDDTEAKAIKALEKTFRPEFLNRLDKVVVFNSLTKEDCTSIIELELRKVAKRLSEKDISMTWDNSLIDYILETGYSEKYGARNLKRKVQESVEDVLADKIINEEIKAFDTVCIKHNGSNVVAEVNSTEVEATVLA